MRLAAQVDANHGEIRDYARSLGWWVKSLAPMGKGWPDFLIGKYGEFWLMEVKDGYGAKETSDQLDFNGDLAKEGLLHRRILIRDKAQFLRFHKTVLRKENEDESADSSF